jgi:uncharacterized tellurite resistance protein B-like protein
MANTKNWDRLTRMNLSLGEGESAEDYSGVFLVAALLVYVSKGDGVILSEESDAMLHTMTTQLGVSHATALENLRDAIMFLAEEKDAAVQLSLIGSQLEIGQKRSILKLMLYVADADGNRSSAEMERISVAARVLGLNQSEVDRVRQAAD